MVLVTDNLNTHTPASLYRAFAPAEAKRLADKLEVHYTPRACYALFQGIKCYGLSLHISQLATRSMDNVGC